MTLRVLVLALALAVLCEQACASQCTSAVSTVIPVTFPSPSALNNSVVVTRFADLDNDGDLDIVYGVGNTKVFFRGIWYMRYEFATSTFGSAVQLFATTDSFYSFDTADIDLDGRVDLCHNLNGCFYGDGDSFLSTSSPACFLGVTVEYLALTKIDGDAFPDLVFGTSTSVEWCPYAPSRTFSSRVLIRPARLLPSFTGAYSTLAVGDMNGDDSPDVLTVQTYSTWSPLSPVVIAYSVASGASWSLTNVTITATSVLTINLVSAIAVADLDGDSRLDMVFLAHLFTPTNDNTVALQAPAATLAVVWGNELFTFAPDATILIPRVSPIANLRVADIDNDGKLDVVHFANSIQAMFWIRGLGARAFAPLRFLVTASFARSQDADIGDYNRDGWLDVVVPLRDSFKVALVTSPLGSSLTDSRNIIAVVPLTSRLAFPIDFDLDGDMDVIVADSSTVSIGPMTLYSGDPSGNFDVGATLFALPAFPGLTISVSLVNSMFAMDMNADGMLDVVVLFRSALCVYARALNGTFVPVIIYAQAEPASNPPAGGLVRALDFDRDGDLDLAATNMSQILLFESVGGLGEPLAFVARADLAFVVALVATNTGNQVQNFDVADIDLDGWVDFAAADMWTGVELATQLFWYRSINGTAFVRQAGPLTNGTCQNFNCRTPVIIADFTGDAVPDVVTYVSNPQAFILVPALSPGVFRLPSPFAVHAGVLMNAVKVYFAAESMDARDFDLDGDLDLAYATSSIIGPDTVELFINLAPGNGSRWAARVVTADTTTVRVVSLDDFNGDALPDVFMYASTDRAMSWFPHTSQWLSTPPPQVNNTVQVAKCGFTVGCIAAAAVRASTCQPSFVFVPPGNYTGCVPAASGLAAMRLNRPVTFVSSVPGARVRVVCLTGAPFATVDTAAVAFVGFDFVGGSTVFAVTDGGQLALRNVSFSGARGEFGSALMVTGPAAAATVTSTSFTNCSVTGTGGAILVTDASLAMDSVSFVACAASLGGALHVGANSQVTVRGASFDSNTAQFSGGAIHAQGAATLVLDTTVFTRNTAKDGFGGALALSAQVQSDAITSIWRSASLAELTPASATGPDPLSLDPNGATQVVRFTAVMLTFNKAAFGGAIASCESFLSVSSWTVSGNKASAGGGWVFCSSSRLPAAFPPGPVPLLWARAESGPAALSTALDATGNMADGFGPAVASSPIELTANVPFPARSVSGHELGVGLFGLSDVYAQRVIGVPIVAQLTLDAENFPASSPAAALVGGLLTASFDDKTGLVDFSSAVLVASNVPSDVALIIRLVSSTFSTVSLRAQVGMDICPPGEGGERRQANYLYCSPCTGAAYSLNNSTDACLPCRDLAPELQVTIAQCDVCRANSVPDQTVLQRIGNSERRPCICIERFYSPARLVDTPCVACPEGASCAGNLTAPLALSGWYPTGLSTFVRCLRPDACAGGTRVCNTGYTGYMCNECVSGYFTAVTLQCERCTKAAPGLFALFVLLLVLGAFVVLMLQLLANTSGATSVDEARRTSRRRRMPYSLSIVIIALQTLGLLGKSDFGWPSSVSQLLAGLSFTNMDISQFSSSCSLGSYAATYFVSLLSPLMFVMLCVVVALLYKALHLYVDALSDLPEMGIVSMVERILAVVGPLLYIPQSRAALQIFDCTRLPNGTWALDAELAFACYTRKWALLAVFGALVSAFFVLGLPVYFVVVLVRSRRHLFEPENLLHYGTLYKLYRRPYYYAEVVQLVRKLLIVGVSLFLSRSIVFLFSALLVIFAVSALVIAVYEPYYHPVYNKLEQRLALSLCGMLALGFVFYANRFSSASARTLFEVVSFVLVVCMLLVMLYTIALEIRTLFNSTAADELVRLNALIAYVDAEGPDLPDRKLHLRIHAAINESVPDRRVSVAEPTRQTKRGRGAIDSANFNSVDLDNLANDTALVRV